MYIDIAKDYFIESDNIIGIFDLDNATINAASRDYLKQKEIEGKLISLNKDLPKSFITTEDGTTFLVDLSSQILRKRFIIY